MRGMVCGQRVVSLLFSSDVSTPTNMCTIIITRIRPNFEPQILSTMTRRRQHDPSKCLTVSTRIQSVKSFLTSHAAAFASPSQYLLSSYRTDRSDSQTSLRQRLIQSYTHIPLHGVHHLPNLLHPQETHFFVVYEYCECPR